MTSPFLSMKINGLNEVKEKLKSLPDKVRAKVSRRALNQAAKILEAEAKARCPKDSGALAASIRTRVSVSTKREQAKIIAGNETAWYAHLVEYGFMHTTRGPKNQRKPTSRGFVDGKAFLRNTAEAKFEPAVDQFEQVVVETVQKDV